MTQAPSHLIKLPHGRMRVLRLIADGGRCRAERYTVTPEQAWCLRCGCTTRRACIGGCAWADTARTICTRCVERLMV